MNPRLILCALWKAEDCVEKVELLGYGEIPFSQSFGVLTAALPEKQPTPYTNCLKITLA